MVTALALQLIQSVVTLPRPDKTPKHIPEEDMTPPSKKYKSNQKLKHGQVGILFTIK
jgi:hypothetical protein